MNPIVAEMGRLFPRYTLTRAQVRAAERADNPADVAASLKVQARDIRKMFDDRLGKGIATDADVIARMNLSEAIGGFGNMSLAWLMEPLGVARAYELGQRAGYEWAGRDHKAQMKLAPWIVELYVKHDNRLPDPEGFAAWMGALKNGHSKEAVTGWIVAGLK